MRNDVTDPAAEAQQLCDEVRELRREVQQLLSITESIAARQPRIANHRRRVVATS